MSNELISILIALATVAVTLAGLILTSNRGLRQDMARLEVQLRGDMKQLESRLEAQINGLRVEINGLRVDLNGLRVELNELRERMSHLEGLREAIAGRAAAR